MSRYALKQPEGDFSSGNGVIYYGNNQPVVPNPGVAYDQQQQQPPMQYNPSMMSASNFQSYVPPPQQQPYIPSQYIVDGVYSGGATGGGAYNPNSATIIQYSFDNNNNAKAHDWNTNPNGGCCIIL